MKVVLSAACGIALFSAVAASPAFAGSAACSGPIVAEGRMPNGLNYDPPRHYNTQTHARARAISAWQAKVRSECGTRASYWPLAFDKSVSCEGYAGGVGCTVRAVPSRG